jgi:outer membrane protein OmpA-like peptidoglycan-associated protein
VQQAPSRNYLLPWGLGVLALVGVVLIIYSAFPASSSDTRVEVSGNKKGAVSAGPAVSSGLPPSLVGLVPNPEKIYFDTGKYETPDNTSRRVASILEYARLHLNSRLVITNFQVGSDQGEPVQRLARQRSMAVRSVLISGGVTEDRIVMQINRDGKDETSTREAARVEVSVSP